MLPIIIDIGPLSFLAPLGLFGLLVLPLIYLLLRATPPQPKDQTFPPLQILRGADLEEETPDRTPLWLLLFRILMVALLAIALANPILRGQSSETVRDVVIVIDDGYASAPNWSQMMGAAENRLKKARRENANAALIYSSSEDVTLAPAEEALIELDGLQPQSLAPNRTALLTQVEALNIGDAELVWLTDGLDYGASAPLKTAMREAASGRYYSPAEERTALQAGPVTENADGFSIEYKRVVGDGPRSATIIATGRDGRIIGQGQLQFPAGVKQARADFRLPADLRNQVAQIRVEGFNSAGAVRLLDDNFGRPVVGIIAAGDDAGQPLLTEVFYAEQALSPFAEVFKAPLEELLAIGPSILIMTDESRIESEALTEWTEDGGLLIRFAGPKLAARSDDLLPVTLRFGDRALGGTLTWEEPQTLAAFDESSPFFGLAIPSDVQINQQVMAESGIETDSRTWARLSDGSPIVTSATRENGRIVLFHVTSSPEWSNLAISGLYVNMLRRILPLTRQRATVSETSTADWTAERVLDGYGRLTAPPPDAKPISADAFASTVPSTDALPGLYRQGSRVQALNAIDGDIEITPLSVSGLETVSYGGTNIESLMGILLAIGLIMLAIDALLAISVTGRWSRLKPKLAASSAVLLFAAIIAMPMDSAAQTSPEDRGQSEALILRFGYVVTGDSRIDDMSEAGMRGLTYELNRRTTVEPGAPRGVNLETDELSLYPLIYWPVSRSTQTPSPEAAANVNQYLAAGGTVVFDTQDYGDQSVLGGAQHPGMAKLSEVIDIPRLVPVPEDHVLTRTYFLLQVFPGRWSGGQVWVDAENIGARDGVASIIVGSNDWATGWAMSEDEQYIGEVEDTIPKHREMAKRFSINLGMYVLAGNYKTDQVHAAAILERLRPPSEREQREDQEGRE